MSARVAVVGASGRVGSAICEHLRSTYEVVEIRRQDGETVERLAARAVAGVGVVINAAGVAHVERPTLTDFERLRVANVELPLALARAALDRSVPMIHISSVKATPGARTAYGRSKFEAEQTLRSESGAGFADRELSLVIIRPLALLFPPLDAGRVARLRFLRRWPAVLTPALRIPVLTPETFLDATQAAVEDQLAHRCEPGVTIRDFGRDQRGTLRDVHLAMRRESEVVVR